MTKLLNDIVDISYIEGPDGKTLLKGYGGWYYIVSREERPRLDSFYRKWYLVLIVTVFADKAITLKTMGRVSGENFLLQICVYVLTIFLLYLVTIFRLRKLSKTRLTNLEIKELKRKSLSSRASTVMVFLYVLALLSFFIA